MLDQNIRNQAEQFVRDIRETDVYKSYTMQLARLKKNPELYKQVNDYRKLNFEMQNAVQVEDLFVDDFLKAELALCRMMQEINALIVDGLNFE